MKFKVVLYVGADVFAKASALLVVPIVSESLGAEQYGALGVLQAALQILVILISLSGNGLIPIKFISEGSFEALKTHAGFIQLSLSILFGLLLLAPLFLIVSSFKITEYITVISIAFLTALSVQSISYLRCKGKFYLISAAVILCTFVSQFGAYLYFSSNPGQVIDRLIFLLIGVILQSAVLLSVDRELIIEVLKYKSKKVYISYFNYGKSLWLHHSSNWLRNFSDRIFVVWFFGATVGGNYTLAMTMAGASLMGFSVLSQAMQPYFYSIIKNDGHGAFLRKLYLISPFLVVTFTIYGGAGVFFWDEVFSKEFSESKDIFIIALISYCLQSLYTFFSHGLFYMKKNDFVVKTSLFSTAVYILLVFLLSDFGVYSLVYSSIIASLLQYLVTVYGNVMLTYRNKNVNLTKEKNLE